MLRDREGRLVASSVGVPVGDRPSESDRRGEDQHGPRARTRRTDREKCRENHSRPSVFRGVGAAAGASGAPPSKGAFKGSVGSVYDAPVGHRKHQGMVL